MKPQDALPHNSMVQAFALYHENHSRIGALAEKATTQRLPGKEIVELLNECKTYVEDTITAFEDALKDFPEWAEDTNETIHLLSESARHFTLAIQKVHKEGTL